jgi:hypothetical protein
MVGSVHRAVTRGHKRIMRIISELVVLHEIPDGVREIIDTAPQPKTHRRASRCEPQDYELSPVERPEAYDSYCFVIEWYAHALPPNSEAVTQRRPSGPGSCQRYTNALRVIASSFAE